MVWLRSDQTLGATALLYLLAVAWTTDTASYAGGPADRRPEARPANLAAKDLERASCRHLCAGAGRICFRLVSGGDLGAGAWRWSAWPSPRRARSAIWARAR